MATEVKNGGVGIVLSFFWTGLGQLYAGRVARGLIMMVATPFIWAAAWFGGGTSLFFGGGTAMLAAGGAATSENMATGGTMTVLGGLFLLAGFAWWIWGMLDARKLCEAFNAAARSNA
jgi:TM2 domain-containing membrane protein YozV